MTMRISKDRIDMDDKVLLKPVLKDYGVKTVTANTGSSYTINLHDGNVHNLTLTANCTFTFSNPPASGTAGQFILFLRQDASGNRTVTWPGAVSWQEGSAPTLSSAGTSVDIITFNTVNGGTNWIGSVTAKYPFVA